MKSINHKNYEIYNLNLRLKKYQQLYEEEYNSSQRAYEEIIELHQKILALEERTEELALTSLVIENPEEIATLMMKVIEKLNQYF